MLVVLSLSYLPVELKLNTCDEYGIRPIECSLAQGSNISVNFIREFSGIASAA